jgi:hypothetical protein
MAWLLAVLTRSRRWPPAQVPAAAEHSDLRAAPIPLRFRSASCWKLRVARQVRTQGHHQLRKQILPNSHSAAKGPAHAFQPPTPHALPGTIEILGVEYCSLVMLCLPSSAGSLQGQA